MVIDPDDLWFTADDMSRPIDRIVHISVVNTWRSSSSSSDSFAENSAPKRLNSVDGSFRPSLMSTFTSDGNDQLTALCTFSYLSWLVVPVANHRFHQFAPKIQLETCVAVRSKMSLNRLIFVDPPVNNHTNLKECDKRVIDRCHRLTLTTRA